MFNMPGRSFSGALPALDEQEQILRDNLRRHVEVLGEAIGERNVWKFRELLRSKEYIEGELKQYGYTVISQDFQAAGETVSNIEATLVGGARANEIVVVGAHYDSVHGCPGANDNGSGVAAVLEVARLLAKAKPQRTIRFVAFVNEEPPFFQGEQMGSVVYARGCKERGEDVVGMLSLETIGYYSDAKGSQNYPAPFSVMFPSTGNFIGFVSDWSSRKLLKDVIGSFRRHTHFPSEGIAAPKSITGVGWSDHWSFWQQGYPALMVTDTAPFRYKHYHQPTDTPDKIDYERTARVVAGIHRVVRELAIDTDPAATTNDHAKR